MHIKGLPYIIPGDILRIPLRGYSSRYYKGTLKRGYRLPLGVITIIHPLKNLSSKKCINVTFLYLPLKNCLKLIFFLSIF